MSVRRALARLALATFGRCEWLDAFVYRRLAPRARARRSGEGQADAIHFFVGSLGLGGTQRQLIVLVRQLVRQGYRCKVWVLSVPGCFSSDLEGAGADWECVFDWPQSPRRGHLFFHLWRLFGYRSHVWPALALAARLRRERPAVLQCLLDVTNVAGALAGRLAGVPIVVAGLRSLHPEDRGTDTPEFQRRCYRLLAPALVDAVIANSVAGKASFLSHQPDMPAEKVHVVLSGLEPPGPAPPGPETRRLLDADPAVAIVVWCGRFVPEKRIDVFLHACAALLRMGRDFQALLIGEGPGLPAAKALAEGLGLTGHVQFLGLRRDVGDLWPIARVAALTSDFEGLPNVLIEAQQAGRPAVATRAGGVSEVVEDGTTGLLCERGDHQGVAVSLARFIVEPAMAERMGRAGAERMRRLFGAQRMGEETLAVYREIAGRRGFRLGPGSDVIASTTAR